MKKLLIILGMLFPIFVAAQGVDVHGQTVGYVYQFDSTDPTKFDVNVPGRTHSCGTTLYRSTSNSEAIANRKFTLIVTAFTANKKIAFRETGNCDGNRMLIGWVRLTN